MFAIEYYKHMLVSIKFLSGTIQYPNGTEALDEGTNLRDACDTLHYVHGDQAKTSEKLPKISSIVSFESLYR